MSKKKKLSKKSTDAKEKVDFTYHEYRWIIEGLHSLCACLASGTTLSESGKKIIDYHAPERRRIHKLVKKIQKHELR